MALPPTTPSLATKIFSIPGNHYLCGIVLIEHNTPKVIMDSYNNEFKPKSFWQRPEGVTGMVFLAAVVLGGGYLIAANITWLMALAANTLYLAVMLVILAALVYMVLDPKMRNLVWYGYRSVMRWVTGLFVQLDPIGILKSYVEDLKDNLRKMNKQISMLRGQMHKLQEIIHNNKKQIESNLQLASRAKASNKEAIMILKSRKAGRLRDSNVRLEDLYKKWKSSTACSPRCTKTRRC
jgi:hypothetical protein